MAAYCPKLGAVRALFQQRVNREAEGRHSCDSHFDRNESIIMPTAIQSCMRSSHRFTCQFHECLSPEFASFVLDLLCYSFCFAFLFLLCMPRVLSLPRASLPSCPDVLLDVATRQLKQCRQCCGHVVFSIWCLCLQSSWKRRIKGCWSISAQVGADSPGLARSRSLSLCAFLWDHAWAVWL